MIFRWSLWGESKPENINLLNYSLASFYEQYGKDHKYVVYTDNRNFVSEKLNIAADVRQYPKTGKCDYHVESKATWLKWCPTARLDVNEVEFHIDADVFLLKHPHEIDQFLAEKKYKFAIMDEYLGQPYQHGTMRSKASVATPFVNAGFFIQKAGCDISRDLMNEYLWWKRNISANRQTHHDEQGALAIALTKYLTRGELFIFPKDKYAIISKISNSNIDNLENVTLFHATYPTHPAFYRFRHVLDGILGIPESRLAHKS